MILDAIDNDVLAQKNSVSQCQVIITAASKVGVSSEKKKGGWRFRRYRVLWRRNTKYHRGPPQLVVRRDGPLATRLLGCQTGSTPLFHFLSKIPPGFLG